MIGRFVNFNEEKKLHPIAFWLLLLGGLASLAYVVYGAIITVMVFAGIEAVTGLAMFAAGAGEAAGIMRWIFLGFNIFFLIFFAIIALIYIIFVIRVIRNRIQPRPQRYLRIVWNITIFYLILSLVSVITGSWASITTLVTSAVILGGLFLQRGYMSEQNNGGQQN